MIGRHKLVEKTDETERSNAAQKSDATIAGISLARSRSTRKNVRNITLAIAVVLLVAGGYTYWRLFVYQPAVIDPFSATLVQSTKFTLYYPTVIPSGYKIDTKTVSQPSGGVVIFDIKSPGNATIYVSEEARPSEFDIGGFFRSFTDLQQHSINDGEIATGKIEDGTLVVGSMLNNNVWVIINTKAHLSSAKMESVLRSLVSTSGERV